MTAIESKIAKALGKRRMAKVDDLVDIDHYICIQLTDGTGDCWGYKVKGYGNRHQYGDCTMSEVVFCAKRFIDESEATAAIRLDRKVF